MSPTRALETPRRYPTFVPYSVQRHPGLYRYVGQHPRWLGRVRTSRSQRPRWRVKGNQFVDLPFIQYCSLVRKKRRWDDDWEQNEMWGQMGKRPPLPTAKSKERKNMRETIESVRRGGERESWEEGKINVIRWLAVKLEGSSSDERIVVLHF